VYDVTGLDPSSGICRNIMWEIGVAQENTGTASNGVKLYQCLRPHDNRPRFAIWPTLIVGHNYLLMMHFRFRKVVTHFLFFGGVF
jgi:hypothetical protein